MVLNLDDLDYLSLGKRTRLHRLMYEHGPGNGRMLILPIDQGMEHGPVSFFPNPPSEDPEFQFKLAHEGGYSGIALHLGLAEKYGAKYAGRVPIVLKVNGKTKIPSDTHALSPMTASVEDAVRVGADAIGYTLYVGSPRQVEDLNQFRRVKADADRYGMPIILWSYPRGEAVDKKGGKKSLYAVDYAARVANELGADAVKLNVPEDNPKTRSKQPEPYDTLELDYEERVRKVIKSAGKTLVLFSGGSMLNDEDLIYRARTCLEQGAAGLLFGRNLWQRKWEDALEITKKLKELMLEL
ncbi:MAG: class I fructose-bisphosphate aldolase [Candidatus Thorarchaeota archaeon SMTZ1-83]|nr:MAG: fructose-bisphosphate aldolase [Candidatus Thorarchaeota archaeon SMTZ1-83]